MSDRRNNTAIVNIERALYGLSRLECSGLGASEACNLLTNITPAILAEIDRARAEEREACAQIARRHVREAGGYSSVAEAIETEIRSRGEDT